MSSVDDAAVRRPNEEKRGEEGEDGFDSEIDSVSFAVDVQHFAVTMRTASSDHFRPEELTAIQNDAQRPQATDAQ